MPYNQNDMRISLGGIPLMEAGQPLDFDATAASTYLREETSKHGTVEIGVSIGAHPSRVSCKRPRAYLQRTASAFGTMIPVSQAVLALQEAALDRLWCNGLDIPTEWHTALSKQGL